MKHASFSTFLRRRLFTGVLTLLGVATAVFALVHLLPGDPAETMLAGSGATPDAIAQLREELGLERPLLAQYFGWLANLAHGDLGRSLFYSRSVAALIAEQASHTLVLASAAFAWASSLGIALGILSARWPRSWIDRTAMGLAAIGVSVPVFWSGLLLIWVFSVGLQWLPAGGAEGWRSIVMPVVVLGTASAGPIARLTRASLLAVLREPYITAARAKGLGQDQVIWRHAVRNAAIPVLNIAAVQLGFLLAGTVVTETLFNRPGLGRLLVDAIVWRDLPMVQGVVLLVAGTYVLVNLAVDIAAGRLDPRAGWP